MTQIISFPVSEDEFERLRVRSQAEGARSVSDYARDALLNDLPGNGNGQSSQHRAPAARAGKKPWVIS